MLKIGVHVQDMSVHQECWLTNSENCRYVSVIQFSVKHSSDSGGPLNTLCSRSYQSLSTANRTV